MSNSNAPAGFQVVGSQGVGEYTGAWKRVAFASGDSTAAFLGSMVKYTGSQIQVLGEWLPVVTLASPSDTKLAGAIQSFDPQRAGSWGTYNRVASAIVAGFLPADPFAYYQAQEDSVGGNIVQTTNTGNNVDFTAESGSTVTGYSTMQIDSSTAANTDTLPLRLVSIVNRVDNDGSTTNRTWLVTVNQSAYPAGSTTGVN